VVIATLFVRESPAGTATTMVLNGTTLNLGSAVGAALGGVLIALGGYSALGFGLPLFAFAAAALAWWPSNTPLPLDGRAGGSPPQVGGKPEGGQGVGG
jgi:predicted MFS family arabinose efflux permease